MEVPVTEYRRRLAHYHAIARAGEPVHVTEHGRPVVRVTGPADEDVIDRLAAGRSSAAVALVDPEAAVLTERQAQHGAS